jgi:DNA-binding CsgD family transcriptional regulator
MMQVVQVRLNLRVAILANDAARAASLRAIVERAGHSLTTTNVAEVVLVQADRGAEAVVPGSTVPAGKPVLFLGARDAGQAGWLPPDASAAQIDAALRAIAVGLNVRPAPGPESGGIEPGFEELVEDFPGRSAHALLTPREIEVLGRVSAGSSNKVIARELGISLHTVKFHIESLFRKLGARTRAEAVARALEQRGRETIEI